MLIMYKSCGIQTNNFTFTCTPAVTAAMRTNSQYGPFFKETVKILHVHPLSIKNYSEDLK